MDLSLFLRGLLIGFSIAAPVGPIGVLCIRRTLVNGRVHGLASGLGAATADACYGSVAALGLTLIAAFLIDQANWLSLIGGIYLCFLGIRTFRSIPAAQAAKVDGRGLLGAYTSTLFLTLTNPMTILSFAAIFAGLGAGAANGNVWGGALLMVAGVFLGSCLWWMILVTLTSLFRSRLSTIGLGWVNRVSGGIIFAFGVIALYGIIATWIVNR
jgi:threonine/homoserine/homoserine lactone efflux protein